MCWIAACWKRMEVWTIYSWRQRNNYCTALVVYIVSSYALCSYVVVAETVRLGCDIQLIIDNHSVTEDNEEIVVREQHEWPF